MESSHEVRVQLTPEEQHMGASGSSPREEASSVEVGLQDQICC